jgi:hypothetical protein
MLAIIKQSKSRKAEKEQKMSLSFVMVNKQYAPQYSLVKVSKV